MGLPHVEIADVGDGLCVRVCCGSDFALTIDCGSRWDAERAFRGLERLDERTWPWTNDTALLVSHFHVDHYNGLAYGAERARRLAPSGDGLAPFRTVFYPGLPTLPPPRLGLEFRRALFAMNDFVLGNESGVLIYDLLSVIRRMQPGRGFRQRPLFQSDHFVLGGRRFDVLWPPRQVTDPGVVESVETAVRAFGEAVESNPDLKRIWDWVQEHDQVEAVEDPAWDAVAGLEPDQDLGESRMRWHPLATLPPHYDRHYRWRRRRSRPYPDDDPVTAANRLLRRAADRLSLAFHLDDQLLVLGDLFGTDIGRVVEQICESRFETVLAAHHGTRWDTSLLKLQANNVLVSHGAGMALYFDEDWKRVGVRTVGTYVSGDIVVGRYSETPTRFPRAFRWPRRFYP